MSTKYSFTSEQSPAKKNKVMSMEPTAVVQRRSSVHSTVSRNATVTSELDQGFKSQSTTSPGGSIISLHHVHYKVRVNDPDKKFGTISKEILTDVSGIFKPGMNAIMGPTGGGKSSLLDVLAGRKNPAGLSGTVLVDGYKQPENFKCMAGYVVQDDVVMGTLTVRENIMFSANLRVSDKILDRHEKLRRVEEILDELDIRKCADIRLGTEFTRGVFGGDRKRTCIGMELVTSPRVLFLDEPTTGLDSCSATALMSLMHVLARRGRTIIFSIHQPRYSIYKEFDTLMLMAKGKVAYHGPSSEALEYFYHLGYQCEAYNNPPDFFLDVVNGDVPRQSSSNCNNEEEQVANNEEGFVVESQAMSGVRQAQAKLLTDRYKSSKWHADKERELKPIWDEYKKTKKRAADQPKGDYQTSFITQFRYLSWRAVINIIRSPLSTAVQLAAVTLMSVVIGIVYLQLGLEYPYDIQNRSGAFFLLVATLMYSGLSALDLFISERKIFIHENASGFYRVSSYFCAKVLCDVIPMRAIPTIFYCIVAYFMMGLITDAEKFFIFVLTLVLISMASSALCFAVSATIGVYAIANLIVLSIFIIMAIFGGLIVNLRDMTDGLSWLQYLSLIRYSTNVLSINEFKNQTYYRTLDYFNSTVIALPNAGDAELDRQGIAFSTSWDLWQNVMAIGLIAFGVLVIAYIQMRRINKYS